MSLRERLNRRRRVKTIKKNAEAIERLFSRMEERWSRAPTRTA